MALFVALGGASYAAIKIPRNSVGAAQIKKNAVTSAKIKKNAVTSTKVKDRSLLAKDFKAGQIPATALFVAVGQDGSWQPDRSSDISGVRRNGVGDYEVFMLADLTKCTAVVGASSVGQHAYFATANILDSNFFAQFQRSPDRELECIHDGHILEIGCFDLERRIPAAHGAYPERGV